MPKKRKSNALPLVLACIGFLFGIGIIIVIILYIRRQNNTNSNINNPKPIDNNNNIPINLYKLQSYIEDSSTEYNGLSLVISSDENYLWIGSGNKIKKYDLINKDFVSTIVTNDTDGTIVGIPLYLDTTYDGNYLLFNIIRLVFYESDKIGWVDIFTNNVKCFDSSENKSYVGTQLISSLNKYKMSKLADKVVLVYSGTNLQEHTLPELNVQYTYPIDRVSNLGTFHQNRNNDVTFCINLIDTGLNRYKLGIISFFKYSLNNKRVIFGNVIASNIRPITNFVTDGNSYSSMKQSLCVCDDGLTFMCTGSSGSVICYNYDISKSTYTITETYKDIISNNTYGYTLAISPDGNYFCVCDNIKPIIYSYKCINNDILPRKYILLSIIDLNIGIQIQQVGDPLITPMSYGSELCITNNGTIYVGCPCYNNRAGLILIYSL